MICSKASEMQSRVMQIFLICDQKFLYFWRSHSKMSFDVKCDLLDFAPLRERSASASRVSDGGNAALVVDCFS
ncbi:MAG: hypothetical protein IM533_03305 [Pseudanabaena sp. M007S1SP1A06QC]|nr:hypothetical protein [Pseudanabaena sp. M007S1SP1A06QC]